MKLFFALAFVALHTTLFAELTPNIFQALPAPENVDGEKQRQRAVASMLANYNKWLLDPETFTEKVEQECGLFPEGQLYPYFMPAMAYTHLAAQQPEKAAQYLAKAKTLMKLGLPVVGKIVGAENDDVLNLKDYNRHATTLSTASIALGLYRLSGGNDPELNRVHQHINQLLATALVRADGQPIHSYPTYSWNFDTVASILGLRLAPDLTSGISIDAIWKKHQLWIERYAFDDKNQLPYSIAGFGYPDGPSPPRGCDVMMRVCILAYVDPATAKNLFHRIRQAMEREAGQFYGYSEYPPQTPLIQDNDSGPIVMGMGLTATGMAIGAARASENQEVVNLLCQQFVYREPLLNMSQLFDLRAMPGYWFWNAVKIKPEYFTGFFFGDAVLFYSLTWSPVGLTQD